MNPYRLAGQKPFEIVEELGGAPDALLLPYGGGGNTAAYMLGFDEAAAGLPRFFPVQTSNRPHTVASAIRITEPVHEEEVADALVRTRGAIVTATDEEIMARAALAGPRRGRVRGAVQRSAGDGGSPARRAGAGEPRRVRRHGARPQGPGRRLAVIHVRAPATTANLGPGFDCAGVALDLWNELEVTDGGEPNLDHLAVRAFALLADPAGRSFGSTDRIPRERGLGSSAATVALGLVAGAPAAAGRDLGPEELLALGLPLEGHADNLAAAPGRRCLPHLERADRPRRRRAAGGARLRSSPAVRQRTDQSARRLAR